MTAVFISSASLSHRQIVPATPKQRPQVVGQLILGLGVGSCQGSPEAQASVLRFVRGLKISAGQSFDEQAGCWIKTHPPCFTAYGEMIESGIKPELQSDEVTSKHP